MSFEEAKTLAHGSELAAAEALPADAIWEFDEPDTRGGKAGGCRICDWETCRAGQGRYCLKRVSYDQAHQLAQGSGAESCRGEAIWNHHSLIR